VPRAIEQLVHDCLAKDPDDRPQSTRELAERFERGIADAQAKADSRAQMQGLHEPPVDTPSDAVTLSLDTPAPTSRTTPARSAGSGRELAGLPFHMEAWMPEAIAVMKLRGFVHDCGGEVLDVVPGLIRVRLGKSRTPTSTTWFGFTRRASGPIDVELHMQKANPKMENHLAIQVLFRPSHASLLADDAWKARCNRLFVELRAYLMGNPSV
jgi:serine/threonine-protein kinase